MIEYPVQVELHIEGKKQDFLLSPDDLHKIVSEGMQKQFKINPDAREEEKTLSRVVKASVKAALIAFGPKLLDLMFKSKDHPKPEKGDDIISWYADMFAKILIAGATQGKLILKANRGEYGQAVPIVINEICPVPSTEGPLRGDTGEARGDVPLIESPDSVS